jgi:glycopeptide antibiotics resistance protein
MRSFLVPFASAARLTPIVVVMLVVAGGLLFAIRSRRSSRSHAARTTALDLGLALWLGFIFLVTVVPFERHGYRPPIGFIPFLDAIQRVVNGETWPSSELADIFLNVVLFVRDRLAVTVLGALALSFAIEVSQALEAAGRFASATDVVTNTTGAALGYAMGRALRGQGASPVVRGPGLDDAALADDPAPR